MYNQNNFKSQHEQDKVLLHFIGEKRDGFFVELGALDGVIISNTYFFEKELGWNGILIEPIPESFELIKKNRNCYASNALISDTSGIEKQFLMVGSASGIINDANPQSSGYWVRENIKNPRIIMRTKTLEEILVEFNAPKYIDFLSLDVEGHEYEVLKNFPFDKYEINIICVENNSEIDKNDNMKNLSDLLNNNNYEKLEVPDFRKDKPNDDFYRIKK